MMKAFRAGLPASPCFFVFAHGAAQMSPDVQRGLVLAKRISCNATPSTRSDRACEIAPPIRDLHKRYPVENLEEAFAEGILTAQPTMPQFRFEPEQIANLIAFQKPLEQRSSSP